MNYYLAVAREESITKAAEVLHITQPTLSRQLALMEEELGVVLFQRGSRGIRLSDEGILLKHRAQEIVALLEKTKEDLQKQEEQIEGTIIIGTGELAAVKTVAEVMDRFRNHYPKVSFRMITGTADLIREQMETGLVDIGILLEPVDMDKFSFIRLPEKEEWSAVMRSDDPLAEKEKITPADLKDRELIMPARNSVRVEVANWLRKNDPRVLSESNLSNNAAMLVKQTGAVFLAVRGSMDLVDPSQIVCRPLSPAISASAVIAWNSQMPHSNAANRFIQCLSGMDV